MSDQKQSQFIEVQELTDSDYVPVFGQSSNRKISKSNLFDQIKDETQIFIYPTIEQLQSADLVADLTWPVYVRVEEAEYRLYKITSLAPGVNDIAMNNGLTATFQEEYSDVGFVVGPNPSIDNAIAVFDGVMGTQLKNGPVIGAIGKNLIEASTVTDTSYIKINTDESVSLRNTSQFQTDLGIDQKVAGPVSVLDSVVALFDGVTGKLIKAGDSIANYLSAFQVSLYNVFPRKISTWSDIGTTPATAGQLFNLVGHTVAGIGGGTMIAKSGSVTDDGGTKKNSGTAGVYLERVDRNSVTLEMFGGRADNSTDNITAFNAAIAYLKSVNGGVIDLESGIYRHSQQLAVTGSGILINGIGDHTAHDGGSGTIPGSYFFYTGATAGIDQIVFTSAGGTQRLNGGGLVNVTLDGNSNAQTGLAVYSWRGARFENIYCVSHTSKAFNINVCAPALSEAKDTQRCIFRNCFTKVTGSVDGWFVSGDMTANASFNEFYNCGARHANGKGWVFSTSDNNVMYQCGAFREPTGTGNAIELLGGDGVTVGECRSNQFLNWSSNGPIVARAGSSGFPSKKNIMLYLDGDNNTPIPTVEATADLIWSFDTGVDTNAGHIASSFGSSAASVAAARSAIGSATMAIHSGSSNQMILTDGANSWGINISGGDLRINRIAGTGTINVGNGTDVKIGSRRWTFVTSVPTTGTWAQGDRAFNIAPAVGSPKGWICTVAGTPGTWVSEGNL